MFKEIMAALVVVAVVVLATWGALVAPPSPLAVGITKAVASAR